MERKVDVAIIGVGTAGLSAYKEAIKQTSSVCLIDKGPLGSTCARIGCMPSKLLIHIANQFYSRHHFSTLGINGAEQLTLHIPTALAYVRDRRDKFTAGVIEFIRSLGDRFIHGEATFLTPNTLNVGDNRTSITAKKIIIATGSSSLIPEDWIIEPSKLLMSENLFEQTHLSKRTGVIGGGFIGLELGQALARLGIEVSLFHAHGFIGGLTDPKVNDAAIQIFQNEFNLYLHERVSVEQKNDTCIDIFHPSGQFTVDSIVAAVGRQPNLKSLNLENIGVELDKRHIPMYDRTTMQIHNKPIYIAGDANKTRPLLHEAADEGRIAGFNAAQLEQNNQCFERRVPIHILFTQPNIIRVGQSFRDSEARDCVIGEVTFYDQGRAKIENENAGILRVYGTKETGQLLGAEGIAPAGEHIAHLLAWAVQKQMTAVDLLQLPFYHPVIEEGMRTALRDMVKHVKGAAKRFELLLCNSEAIQSLS